MERGSYLASRYEPTRERAYHLGLITGQGTTAWAVHEVATGAPVALAWGHGAPALDDELLPTHPVTVSFITLPEWSTLVPDGALAPGTEARHLALVHGGMPAGAMRAGAVRELGATCIYVHDDRLERPVLERFPHARSLPMQAVMVNAVLARSTDRPALVLHRGGDRADVALAAGGQLLLSNTYPARSAQDLLYFLLLAVERSGLKPADVVLHFGGTHLTTLEGDLLARYFAHMAPAAEASWGEKPLDTADTPERWWAALEQFACAS